MAFAILEKAGFNVAEIQAILPEKVEKASAANARQEEWKRKSKAQTEETVALTDDLYRTASGYLAAAIAAVRRAKHVRGRLI